MTSYTITPKTFLHRENTKHDSIALDVILSPNWEIFPYRQWHNDIYFVHDAAYKRYVYTGALLALIVGSIAYFRTTTPSDLIASGSYETLTPQSLLEQINTYRFAQGLPALTSNAALMHMAQLKADDMASRQYYGHLNADGKDIFQANPQYSVGEENVGETLALGFDTPITVASAWEHDPASLKSIDNSVYTDAGVGIARGKWIDGSIKTFVVLEVGEPATEGISHY